MPTNLPKCEIYLVQRVDYFRPRSEILERIPTIIKSSRVEPVRIGQYHEREFGLPGELVDKGA